MTIDGIVARVVAFIDGELLGDDAAGGVDATTPLLQNGLLDSLRTAMLLNFIRSEFGVAVRAQAVSFRNFETPHTVGLLVARLLEESEQAQRRQAG